MPPSSRPTAVRARWLLAATATLLAGGASLLVLRARAGRPAVVVESTGDGAAETSWNGQDAYVVDPVAGLRVRRSSVMRHPMVAVDLSDAQVEIVKHRDRHGFLRERDLPEPPDRPVVLVVGDSHVDGVVSTADNVTSLLEAGSAATPQPYYCLNAGCGYYSLWQHVLRARDLLPRYRPRVVAIVVFLGNDFHDLDNPTVPHLTDDLREVAGGALTEQEAARALERERELGLQHPHQQLFWQGLNQALRLHRDPALLAGWLRKARHAVRALRAAADANDARVVWVLLPSFDLVFPEQAGGLSPLAAEVVRGGAQRRLRDAFAALLAEEGARVVDAEPALRADGRVSQYALDFHLFRQGHQRLAEVLAEPIRELLAR